MFSGIQEILVLVIIILGIFFLPRILNRGRESRPAMPRPPAVISGKMRLALSASVLWPAIMAAFMQPWEKDFFLFLYIGLGPVAFIWMIYWVFTEFHKR